MGRPARRAWPGLESGYTFKDEDLRGLPAAGYFRVSSNPDGTEQKSVGDQEAEYWPWATRTGVVSTAPRDVFRDDDRSASVFATKARENFARLREAIEAERYKVIWFWSTSRQTRGDVNIYELAKVSADHGVLWCMAGQLLNPANEDDLLFLGIHHLMDRQYSWRISKDTRRGLRSAALAGKPVHLVPYGYRRVYDHTVRVNGRSKFIRDEPDTGSADGRIEDSPAYVVREIYDRIERGHTLGAIARSLEDRGIPRPRRPRKYEDQRCHWTINTIRTIAQNPYYAGKRIYQAASWRPADRRAAILELPAGTAVRWESLIGEEQWWRVQRILDDTERQKFRPGSATGLLTGVVRCARDGCGMPLHASRRTTGGKPYAYYRCNRNANGCANIAMDWLDGHVEDRIVLWLADPAVHASLWAAGESDDTVAVAARADAERLRHKLEECRRLAEDPEADAVLLDQRARALRKKLTEAEELSRPSAPPAVVADATGPDAADKWAGYPLAVKREIIRTVADIRVRPRPRPSERTARSDEERRAANREKTRRYYARQRGEDVPRLPPGGRPLPVDESRVEWRWLLGPDAARDTPGAEDAL